MSLEETVKREWENDALAFEVTVEAMETYANKCNQEKNPDGETMMNPIEGSYVLVKNLVTSLLYKAEGHEESLLEVIQEAIDDAVEINKKMKEAS